MRSSDVNQKSLQSLKIASLLDYFRTAPWPRGPDSVLRAPWIISLLASVFVRRNLISVLLEDIVTEVRLIWFLLEPHPCSLFKRTFTICWLWWPTFICVFDWNRGPTRLNIRAFIIHNTYMNDINTSSHKLNFRVIICRWYNPYCVHLAIVKT